MSQNFIGQRHMARLAHDRDVMPEQVNTKTERRVIRPATEQHKRGERREARTDDKIEAAKVLLMPADATEMTLAEYAEKRRKEYAKANLFKGLTRDFDTWRKEQDDAKRKEIAARRARNALATSAGCSWGESK